MPFPIYRIEQMYLPAVDYAAFRIETSQFHDFEAKKKLPPRSLPFTALDQPHIPHGITASSQLVIYLDQSGSLSPLCKIFLKLRKNERK